MDISLTAATHRIRHMYNNKKEGRKTDAKKSPFSPRAYEICPRTDPFLFPTTAHRGFPTVKTTPSSHLLFLQAPNSSSTSTNKHLKRMMGHKTHNTGSPLLAARLSYTTFPWQFWAIRTEREQGLSCLIAVTAILTQRLALPSRSLHADRTSAHCTWVLMRSEPEGPQLQVVQQLLCAVMLPRYQFRGLRNFHWCWSFCLFWSLGKQLQSKLYRIS